MLISCSYSILNLETSKSFSIYDFSYGYNVADPNRCRVLIKKSWHGHLKTILANANKSGAGSMPPLQESEKLLIEIFGNNDMPDSFKVCTHF